MPNNKYIIISIDGAAGSGKSTTAKSICEKFNYIHVDTGLHYRSLCFFFLNKNISADFVPEYLCSNTILLSSKVDSSSLSLLVDDEYYPPELLRNKEMNREVSYYARLPELRSLLLSYQQSLPTLGKKMGFSGIVMDGRDIGSVVLPFADLKLFLHANLEITQNRRLSDGECDSIHGRDQIDLTRKVAPLVCPPGALSIDSGLLSLPEVVGMISDRINQIV